LIYLFISNTGIGNNLMSPSAYCDWLTDDAQGRGLFFNDYYNFNEILEYNQYVRESPASHIAKEMINTKVGLYLRKG